MYKYQTAVQETRSSYFTDLISQRSHNSRALFRVIQCHHLPACRETKNVSNFSSTLLIKFLSMSSRYHTH